MGNQQVKTGKKSWFWRTFAILGLILACCILLGLGGTWIYNENQALVNATSTADALYGPATATANALILSQAPSDPAIRAPDCAKMWASYDKLAPADQKAYLSSLNGKWIFNWRTRIVTIVSIPSVMGFGGNATLITRTDDDCAPGGDVPEAARTNLRAQQYIRVSGRITGMGIVSGSISFVIDTATFRVSP